MLILNQTEAVPGCIKLSQWFYFKDFSLQSGLGENHS